MEKFLSTQEFFKLLAVFFLCFVAIAPSAFWWLYGYIPGLWFREGGLYESVGAISCFVAGVLMFFSFKICCAQKQYVQSVWCILFSIGCLFIAGEEVSWGQEYFGYEVSDAVLAANFQNEFNLHNSKLFQSSNNDVSSVLFKLLMLYFIFLPMFVAAFKMIEKAVDLTAIPVPSMLIAIVALLAKMADILNYKVIYGSAFVRDRLRVGEGVESLIEVCLLILAIECFVRLKTQGHRKELLRGR